MTTDRRGDHLEQLPSRAFLFALAVATALAIIGGVTQLAEADDTGASLLWGLAIGIGTVTLLALGIAWEERRSHIHALVREALEEKGPVGADSIAELLRMGAHREVDYLRSRVEGEAKAELH